MDSIIQRRYVNTATEDPPSISEDSIKEGYLGCESVTDHVANMHVLQQLPQEQKLEMVQEVSFDFCRCTMLQDVLPENEVGKEGGQVRLEV